MDMNRRDAGKRPLHDVRINGIAEIGRGAFVLRFDRMHDFLPGQVLALTVDDGIPPRLFSICSGNREQETELLFTIKTEGLLSPRLAACRKGDRLRVSAPFGTFVGDATPAWWIAAGTGIAPYRSMLRSGLDMDKMLIHGGRTADRFYFEAEMQAAFGTRYVRCCSQETGNGLYGGRLTNWLRDYPQLPTASRYFLCGSAEMVVETRDILIGRGIAIDNILSEIYF
jgi:ferredoxin--NADP+ reductase